MGEGDAVFEIETANAIERKSSGGKGGLEDTQNFAGLSSGETRDIVADRIDIGSGETYRKAKKVWDASKEGDDFAQELVDSLDAEEESIHGAYTSLKDARKEVEEKEEEEPDAVSEEELDEEETQSDSKASDTGTQTDEGGSEGDESYNDYRDKTFSQKMGEGDAIKVIAEGNAKDRQGTRTDLDEHRDKINTKWWEAIS